MNKKEQDKLELMSKEIEEMTDNLLIKYGYSFALIIHIIRYSTEKHISVHEIIQSFKDNAVSIKYAACASFDGYKRFKEFIELFLKK